MKLTNLKKRILSAALAMAMLFTLLPATALAAEGEQPAQAVVILGFDAPAQTEYTVALGTALGDIGLPDTLAATIEGETGESAATVENVTWSGDYDADKAGVYSLSAYAECYTLFEGVEWPSVVVSVLPAAPELELEPAAEPQPQPDEIDLFIAAVDALPELNYDNVDIDDEEAFSAWLDEQYVIYAEVPSLDEQFSLYSDDTAAMERIGAQRADKLAGLYTMLFGAAVMAEPTDKWTSYAAAVYESGSGTVADPYIINTPEQLAYLSNQVNVGKQTYSGKYFKLGANIDLSAHYWTPIGHDDGKFKGAFDGSGYTIYGMNVVDGYRSNLAGKWLNAGFFGTADAATITNVNLVGATINVTQTYNQTMNVGGLGGYICNSDVTDCSFNGTIYAKFAYDSGLLYAGQSNIYIGGIVGRTYSSSGAYGSNFTNCAAFGSIAADSIATYAKCVHRCVMGGIGGETSWGGDGRAIMTNCYANSTLTDTTKPIAVPYFGGVVGNSNMKNTSSKMYYRYPEAVEKGFGNRESSLPQSAAEYLDGDTMKTTMIAGLPGWNQSPYVNDGYPIPSALYTLTCKANGGDADAAGAAAFGYPVALPAGPTRTGYTFTGWYDAPDSGTQYNAGAVYLHSGGTTLYAHWVCSGHVYTNSCDTTCNTCGEVRSITHTPVTDAAVAPTCTTTGLTEGSHCSVCHTIIVAQTVVPATGHTAVTDPAVAPSCTTTGLTAGSHCSVCDTVLTAQTVVPANGHTAVTDAAVAPTCTATGLTEGSHCSVCSETLVAQQTVAALGHSYVDTVTAPTCTERGYTTHTCSRGDSSYVDNYVAALGHTAVTDAAVAATCTATGLTEGSHCSVCSETLVAQTTVPALGHSYVDTVTAPTCTERGYTTHTCSRGDNSYADSYVAALGHTPVTDPAVAPTCTATGLAEGSHCSVCSETLVAQTTVPALGHSYVDTVTAPTCTSQGYTTHTCSRGDNSYADNYVAALGHTPVIDAAVAPTCTETGLTAGSHCSVCGDVIAAQTETAALGHEMIEHTSKPATAGAEGNIGYWHCSRCGKYFSDAGGNTEIAQATTIVYYIGYSLQGGAVSPANPSNYTVETADFTLTNPTRIGYAFSGWTGSNGTTAQTSVTIAKGSIGQRTYTATWTANGYTVTYDGNKPPSATGGVSGLQQNQNCTYDASFNLGVAPVLAGYDFAGWATTAGGTVAYAAGASVKNLTAANGGSVTLYAKWTAQSYTIAYTGMDGATHGTNHPTTHTYGTSTSISDPTKPGYTFDGWKVNGGAAAKNLTLAANAYTADVTLAATWLLNKPAVNLAVNPSGGSAAYGAAVTLTATASHTLTSGLTYSYEWYKDSAKTSGSANALTLRNVSDSGSYTVKVTASDGSLISAATESNAVSVSISAAAHDKPAAPSIASKTYGSITVTAVSGQKYLCRLATADTPTTASDGWQYTGAFTGLSPDTAYKIYTYKPAADSNHASSPISDALAVATNRVKITSVTAPGDTVLGAYHTTGDSAKAALAKTAASAAEDGTTPRLSIAWAAPQSYDSAPGAVNTFSWSVSAPTGYEFASGLTAAGSVAVTNKAATAVSITGTNSETTYNGSTYDVSKMFSFDTGAGEKVYSVERGGSGAGTLSGSALTITKAGTINIKVATEPGGNYAAASAEATLTVNKGSVTVPTITGKAYTGQALSADITGSDADNSFTVTANTGGISAGNYDVALTLNKPDLYQWSDGTTTAEKVLAFSISQAANEWQTAFACAGFIYDGTTPLAPAAQAKFGAISFTYSTVSDGQYAELPPSGIKNAGAYYIKATVEGNTDYSGLVAGPLSVSIGKVKLTPSVASVAAREYNGGTDATGTISVTAALGYAIPAGETPRAGGTFAWTAENAGTATVNVSDIALTNAAVNKNYELDAASLTSIIAPGGAKIRKANLTVTANAHTITYGDALTDNGVSYRGFAAGENSTNLSGALAFDYSYARYEDIGGSHTLTPKGITAANYEITFESGALTVNPRPVTVTIADKSSAYGAALAELTATVSASSIVNNDSVYRLTTSATASSAVGENYTITGQAIDGNYAVTFVGSGGAVGKYSITNATLSGVSVTGYSGAYDGTAHCADKTAAATAVNGQAITWKFGVSADACTQDHITVKDAADSGTYYYKASAPNHAVATGSFAVSIARKALTVTANNHTITYGDALTDNGVSYRGFAAGENSTNLSGALAFDYSYARYEDIRGSHTLTPKGITAANYEITFESGTLTVNPRPVTVTIADKSSAYGAALAELTATVSASSIVNNDSVYSLTTSATANSAVGENYTITGTPTDSNYAVTFVGSGGAVGKYSITNATLSGVSVTGYSGAYDGTAHSADKTAAATATNGQAITWKFGVSADACTQNHITVKDAADSGTYYYKASAPNHAVATGSFAVSIARKALTADMIGSIPALIYNGETQTPAPSVSWTPGIGSPLILTAGEDKDFTFSYACNTDAALSSAATNAPTVTVTAVDGGNYSGSAHKTFTIDPLTAQLVWSGHIGLVYDGADKTVTAAVSNRAANDGNEDFTLAYSGNTHKNAGDYTAAVTDLGNTNYALPAAPTIDFTIAKAPVSFTVADNEHTYDTRRHTATVTQTAGQTPIIATSKFSVGYQSVGETATADKTDAGEYAIIITLTDDNLCFAGERDEDTRSHTLSEKLTIGKKPVTAQWKNLVHVYDGAAKTPVLVINDGDVFSADSGKVSAEPGANAKSAAGTHTVTASLTGNRAENYELTNPTGSLIIQKAPVTFTVSDNSVQHDGSAHLATVTATANGRLFTSFTVSYKNAKGESVATPVSEGGYDIYGAIADPNYRHAGSACGAARKIGVLTIYKTTPPTLYTISFDSDGGTAVPPMIPAQAGTERILPPCGYSGKVFRGWQYHGGLYESGTALTQPESNITLKALWADETYPVGGTVDENGNPVQNVVVTLTLGSRQIGQTVTDAGGRYRFNGVLPGVYNLAAHKDGVTKTILVVITDTGVENNTITMPGGKLSSVVEVTAGTPAVVVGNLENAFTPQDVQTAGDTHVVLKLTAEAVAADDGAAQQAISRQDGAVGLYLELTLTKTVGGAAPETLASSPVLLTAVITLPATLQGKDIYTVYRMHGGELQTLTAAPNSDGEKIVVSVDKTTLTVYAKNFSTYAVSGSNRPITEDPIPVPDESPVSAEAIKTGVPVYNPAAATDVSTPADSPLKPDAPAAPADRPEAAQIEDVPADRACALPFVLCGTALIVFFLLILLKRRKKDEEEDSE